MTTARETLRELLSHRLADQYRIVEEIGIGGMAVVYLAENLDFGRLVALKVLRPDRILDADIPVRFRSEAIAIAQLRHPNIIGIHSRGEEDGLMWFEMDYVEGGSLEQALDTGPLDWVRVARLVAQAADGLAYAHGEGVIHRDIKPSNLLLSPTGEHLTITDFGIAKILGRTTLTETGKTVGTVAYMSPEQLMAEKSVTGATDQYSLGIVAFESLTGGRPFGGETSGQNTYAKMSLKPPAISSLRPDCPPDLEALVMRMLSSDPELRWPDLRDVRQIAEEIAVSGDSPHLHGLPTARAPRRRRRARLVGGLLAAASVGLAASFLAQRRVERPPAPLPLAIITPPLQAQMLKADSSAESVQPTAIPQPPAPTSRQPPPERQPVAAVPTAEIDSSAADSMPATASEPVQPTATLVIWTTLESTYLYVNDETAPHKLTTTEQEIVVPAGRIRLRIVSTLAGCTDRVDVVEVGAGERKKLWRTAHCPDS